MAQAKKAKTGEVVTLAVIAILLAVGYVALDFYSDGEKNKTITESRGIQLAQALSRYRLENASYPDALDKLVPKYLQLMPKCPSGDAFAYQFASGEYTLTCQNVGFKTKPYTFDSRSRLWQG
jgi:type II secretory pathway pseudopilin PulG